MKKVRALIFITFVFVGQLAIAGNDPDDLILGRWVRKVDLKDDNPAFQGNIIEIIEDQQLLKGKLVWLTDETAHYGYRLGDIKWDHIQKIDGQTYIFKGALIRTDLSAPFNGSFYVDCKLTILDTSTIKIEAHSDHYDFAGQYQIWERLEPL